MGESLRNWPCASTDKLKNYLPSSHHLRWRQHKPCSIHWGSSSEHFHTSSRHFPRCWKKEKRSSFIQSDLWKGILLRLNQTYSQQNISFFFFLKFFFFSTWCQKTCYLLVHVETQKQGMWVVVISYGQTNWLLLLKNQQVDLVIILLLSIIRKKLI